jgi:hypothetical protein
MANTVMIRASSGCKRTTGLVCADPAQPGFDVASDRCFPEKVEIVLNCFQKVNQKMRHQIVLTNV